MDALVLDIPGASNALATIAPHPVPPTAMKESGLAKGAAEELLDWLESHGYRCELSFIPGEGFTVEAR